MHDIVEFLRQHAPFDDLDDAALEELARVSEVEFFPAGATVFRRGEGPIEHVRIVRKGAIELVSDGETLDVLGEGELFGHPSMLSGRPAWFEARAGEDTLCYRLPAEAVLPLLTRPAGLRFVARSLVDRPSRKMPSGNGLGPGLDPVMHLLRGPALICDPGSSVREVARRMADAESGAALVRLGDEELGIVTDRDLRDRVVAGDLGLDAPVTEVMTAPAFTLTPERSTAEAMLEMLDRGIRHLPIVWPHGEVLGVLEDRDLLVAETRAPFALRREIQDAADTSSLRPMVERLRSTVVSLHDAELPPAQVAAIISVVADAITRRLVDLAIDGLGPPPEPVLLLALGGFGRREVVPSSDIDSALVWDGDAGEAERYMERLGTRITADLADVGFPTDTHGATAAKPLFRRSLQSWREAIRSVVDDPEQENALTFISLLSDARPTYRLGRARNPLDELAQIRHRRPLLRLLLTLALSHRPPSGLRRLRPGHREHSDDGSSHRRGTLDIKEVGLLPITSIARYASLAAGTHATTTRERLSLASTGGTLDGRDARMLSEAFDLFWRLRLDHQVEQLRAGAGPDDLIEVERLTPVTRGYVREAFHAVSSVQRALRGEMALPP